MQYALKIFFNFILREYPSSCSCHAFLSSCVQKVQNKKALLVVSAPMWKSMATTLNTRLVVKENFVIYTDFTSGLGVLKTRKVGFSRFGMVWYSCLLHLQTLLCLSCSQLHYWEFFQINFHCAVAGRTAQELGSWKKNLKIFTWNSSRFFLTFLVWNLNYGRKRSR